MEEPKLRSKWNSAEPSASLLAGSEAKVTTESGTHITPVPIP